MRFTKYLSAVAMATGVLAMGAPAVDADAHVNVTLEPYVTGINTPLAMVQPPGDDRKFVLEQFGRIRIINGAGELLAEPFLDIRSRMPVLWADFDERGLLGIAFHPNFASNGKFYISYSAVLNFQADLGKEFWWDHTNVVAEYTVSSDDPNVADPSTERLITSIDWPQFNHNGHWIDFGADGMLYISVGDGGYANDWGIGHNVTEGNGQDTQVLNGSILRIDINKSENGNNYAIPPDNPFVGNDDVLDEIWAYGFRNPWRCSFDTGSGDLYCGDVMQNSYEEIDVVVKGGNYGWRRTEGSRCFDYTKPNDHPSSCDTSGGASGASSSVSGAFLASWAVVPAGHAPATMPAAAKARTSRIVMARNLPSSAPLPAHRRHAVMAIRQAKKTRGRPRGRQRALSIGYCAGTIL